MLRVSQCLAADDVTIRCRVRHSEKACQREFTEPQEMICTMRMWHKTNTPSAADVVRNIETDKIRSFETPLIKPKCDNHGPELLLTPTDAPVTVHACCAGGHEDPIKLSERFSSFGIANADVVRHRSTSRPRLRISSPVGTSKALSDVTISIADIMVVDMVGQGSSHQCSITTLSSGYFELTMENRNGQDVLFAFLKATLPKDRVIDSMHHRARSELSNHTAQSSCKSFDVEAFTAKRMSERLQSETLSEKLRRKVVRVFSSIEEISASLSECACGCPNDSTSRTQLSEIERRDAPPHGLQYEQDLSEMTTTSGPPESQMRRSFQSPEETIKRQQILKSCNLPSGLSVEGDESSAVERVF